MKIKNWMLIVVSLVVLGACGGGPAGGPSGETESEPEAAPVTEGDGGDQTEVTTDDETAPVATKAQKETTETDVAGETQLAAELSIYNWSDYIGEEELTAYEETYGVKLIYDTYASNEDLLAKLQAGATGYDVIFPSDYMVAQMIELGLLAEFDADAVPNFANISDAFKDAPFDPGNKHCVPYQWGTTGLAYRAGDAFFEENMPDSWAYLFEPDLLEQISDGGVNVLDDQRELMAAALFYLGHSPNSTERAELEGARDLILQAKPYWKNF